MYPLNNDGEYLKDTNSLFDTSFAEYPFNYKKNFDARQVQQKQKVDEVLVFCISKGSSKQFCNFVSGANLSE